MKIAYQTDLNGYYMGTVPCQPSPLEPGVYLIPGGATEVEPPEIPDGKVAKFNWGTGAWVLEKVPTEAQQQIQTGFAAMSVDERKAFFIQVRDAKLKGEVGKAFELFTWHEWNGTPIDDPVLKKAWADYRKALIAFNFDSPDYADMSSVEDFVWPNMPALPPEE